MEDSFLASQVWKSKYSYYEKSDDLELRTGQEEQTVQIAGQEDSDLDLMIGQKVHSEQIAEQEADRG